MRTNVIVHTPTKEEFIKVVQKCFDNGVWWLGGDDRISEEEWNWHKDQTCICIDVRCDEKNISYAPRDWFNRNYSHPIISAQEFLGEPKNIATSTSSYYTSPSDFPYIAEPSTTEPIKGYFYNGERITSEEYKKLKSQPEPNKGRAKIMNLIKNIFKGKEARALSHFEITNGDGGLTSTGRDEFVDYLWETLTDSKKDFIKKVVEEHEKLNK